MSNRFFDLSRRRVSLLPWITLCASFALSGAAQNEAARLEKIRAPKKTSQGAPDLKAPGWVSLFDGKSLEGWAVTNFAGHGDVQVQAGKIVIHYGEALSGIQYTNSPPVMNYELSVEAMKEEGGDFFSCITFPFGKSHCSFVPGGWGGTVVGISSIDGFDASENETSEYFLFKEKQWYRFFIRVSKDRIETWIDDKKIVDLDTKDKEIGMRFGEIELSAPLGIATWMTTGVIRDIRIRRF